MASTAIRSAFRSFRASAPKPQPSGCSFFQSPKQKPLSQRIFLRPPVELSCCVDSLMPFHTATSTALLNSMLGISTCASWLPQDCSDDV